MQGKLHRNKKLIRMIKKLQLYTRVLLNIAVRVDLCLLLTQSVVITLIGAISLQVRNILHNNILNLTVYSRRKCRTINFVQYTDGENLFQIAIISRLLSIQCHHLQKASIHSNFEMVC